VERGKKGGVWFIRGNKLNQVKKKKNWRVEKFWIWKKPIRGGGKEKRIQCPRKTGGDTGTRFGGGMRLADLLSCARGENKKGGKVGRKTTPAPKKKKGAALEFEKKKEKRWGSCA